MGGHGFSAMVESSICELGTERLESLLVVNQVLTAEEHRRGDERAGVTGSDTDRAGW